MTGHSFHESRSFGPTLEWEALPEVGADRRRHMSRAYFWRVAPFIILAIWIGIAAALGAFG